MINSKTDENLLCKENTENNKKNIKREKIDFTDISEINNKNCSQSKFGREIKRDFILRNIQLRELINISESNKLSLLKKINEKCEEEPSSSDLIYKDKNNINDTNTEKKYKLKIINDE